MTDQPTTTETPRRVRTPSPAQLRAAANLLRESVATTSDLLLGDAAMDTARYLDHVAGKSR